jgi:hypothetical protein
MVVMSERANFRIITTSNFVSRSHEDRVSHTRDLSLFGYYLSVTVIEGVAGIVPIMRVIAVLV